MFVNETLSIRIIYNIQKNKSSLIRRKYNKDLNVVSSGNSGGQPSKGGCGEHVQREHEEPPRDHAGIGEDSLQREDVENMSRENMKNLHEIMHV
jgi:hypothetical protein